MVKVKATSASKIYNKALKEFHRIVEEGEVFELTEERFKFLNGDNSYKIKFVVPVDEPIKPIHNIKTTEPAIQVDEVPDIFVIEPGKEPVQVDENLKPVEKPKKKKSTTTKASKPKAKE